MLPRGGGTSLAGQCCNLAVVMDFSKYVNRIVDIDLGNREAIVQPGLIFDHLRNRVQPHGLTVAFDTSTHDHATIGGMVGYNSCGVHSVLAQQRGAAHADHGHLGGRGRGGVPIVGLEPSCVAVFRDELVNLFPDDDRAKRRRVH